MVGDSLGYRDHAEVACGVRCDGCRLVGVHAMTLLPHEARLILACMGAREGAIRPGDLTGLMRLEIETRLRECADKDGEE